MDACWAFLGGESIRAVIKGVGCTVGESVRYRQWEPEYERIRAEFGFPFDRERAASERLVELLPKSALERAEQRIRARIRGRDTIVVGLAPHAGAPPVWMLPRADVAPALVVADGATERCLAGGLVPDVVVSDLDGPVPSEVTANVRGALVLVHAHGDNIPALEKWVPQFPRELAGSWAGPPERGLVDFGGFTDGDRGAYLAEYVGAPRILLYGFDFDHVDENEPAPDVKRRKLAVARRVLDLLAREGRSRLEIWAADGTLSPYVPQSTQ
jgi:2-amino-4-hydroxy-6-hydroxymethyldihydropteridine diphosphokinase